MRASRSNRSRNCGSAASCSGSVPFFCALALSAVAAAQEPAPRSASAVRVDAPPRIDGRLDDAAWRAAQIIDDFRRKEPLAGEPATEATRVRLVYDAANLYVGVALLDSAPQEIRATELRRDNTLESDDTFSILLDTFHDRRNAAVFRINPRGTRFDALIRNENRFYHADWGRAMDGGGRPDRAGLERRGRDSVQDPPLLRVPDAGLGPQL